MAKGVEDVALVSLGSFQSSRLSGRAGPLSKPVKFLICNVIDCKGREIARSYFSEFIFVFLRKFIGSIRTVGTSALLTLSS